MILPLNQPALPFDLTDSVRDPQRNGHDRIALITGGAGFVGSNLAHRLLSGNRRVIILDSLARPGVQQNIDWLQREHNDRLMLLQADVRDAAVLRQVAPHVSEVFHLAAQVAVTTSLTDPVEDFQVNAWGTLNLLEALRRGGAKPIVLFTSTNKVYGALDDIRLHAGAKRYEPDDAHVRRHGVAERSLHFASPYGCSKGCADQYVLDYAHTYGLPTVVFRMSCIYGPHQFGTEDQGWVAHFLRHAVQDRPITLYGDGRQVRDLLFIDDLVDAMLKAVSHIDHTAGQAFNLGGGPDNSLSLLELMDLIAELHGRRPHLQFEDWRVGDQRYYVSDTRKFASLAGWSPRVGVSQGVRRLYDWVQHLERSVKLGSAAAGSGA